MEKDDEITGSGNSYDFGARIYDSRLGRWLSLDPIAKEYPSLSDYCFVANTPLQAVDPDGKKIYYVGDWSAKAKRAQNKFLKTTWGKAVFKEFQTSTKNDIYIKIARDQKNIQEDLGGRTLPFANNYFEDGSWPWEDSYFELKDQYKNNESAEKIAEEFNGVPIMNKDATVHFILLSPKLESSDRIDEYEISEVLLHEIIAHIWIPLERGETLTTDSEKDHGAYGSEKLGDNVPGSIADEVHKEMEELKEKGDGYVAGDVGDKKEKVKKVAQKTK